MSLLSRRRALLTFAAAALLSGCSLFRTAPPAPDPHPPIVFVHGNGDTAALWHTTVWRFESNGWPRERLHAIDLPYPLARDDEGKPQDGRSSTTEHMQFLSAEVDKVLKATGARRVVLVGNSRGGYAIRNYIANGGGTSKVSHAVLGGTPNHGVWADPKSRTGSEFNGAGPFLTALNAPKGPNGDEVTPGVRWMTIRSDNNDKFAQPDGVWIGAKGVPTNVSFAGPALKGAEDVVVAGIDHRETSFGPQAFAATYRFIARKPPATTAITSQAPVVLNGKVSGLGINNTPGTGNFANNLPLAGATVEVYATNAATGERQGAAVHRKTVGADGLWGPFTADGQAAYEFVIAAPGFATTHIYRSPFPRSSDLVNLRAERIADADRDAKSVVTLTRPRGYFGIPRDDISLDGRNPPGGIPPGIAGVSTAKLKVLDAPDRPVEAAFNGERIVGQAWPAAQNHVVFLELHH
ncbi:alpha/beta fold hydrolase [Piscinibacter sp.]|uniref:alpha/beta fold hydrolase n=1 Tax=Piscinibacter sp. TaxID=1903157 RepID=UPI002C526450|nr:alpha/beta fold hydrolase [Albitalea sp.]HUG24055.1 alpha/beta fold hydrolase [Albitalea sp.]